MNQKYCYLCLEEQIFDWEGKELPLTIIPVPGALDNAIWFCDDCIISTLKEVIGIQDLFEAAFLHRARVKAWKKQLAEDQAKVDASDFTTAAALALELR